MALSYFGARISEHMLKTPEGYLVCMSVPLARTGTQDYMPEETPDPGRFDRPVPVLRPEAEVFDPASLASYEGKPVTDGHPSVDVDVGNHGLYARGFVKNVARGSGDYADCLLGDLVVTDPGLISQIEAGKRDVSSGYEALWLPTAAGFEQQHIRCNHVAIVQAGRAGPKVSIRDGKPKGESQSMNISPKELLLKMFKHFANDASPEEIAEAAKLLADDPGAGGKKGAEDEFSLAELAQRIEAIEAKLETLVYAEKKKEEREADPIASLDELALELEGEEEKEDEDRREPEVVVKVETEEEAKSAKDAAISQIKLMKPIIGGIKDPAERKRACDSLVAALRKTTDEGYKKLLAAKAATKKYKAADSEKSRPELDADRGRRISEKYHPLKGAK